jgi:hypothetical protein
MASRLEKELDFEHADIKSAILPEVASNGVQESAAKAFCPGQSGRTFAGLGRVARFRMCFRINEKS